MPAYNEERHITQVVRGARELGFPTLVVDDASADATVERARVAGAEVVRHERNRGKGMALATGFAWARERGFAAAVVLDGDGQHDPAEIPLFVACTERTGADIVVGSRFLRRGCADGVDAMPPHRKITNWFMSRVLSRMAGTRLTDTQSGFRLVRTDAWFSLGLSTGGFDTESEMLVRASRLGMLVREVPIRTIYGDEVSSISPVRDTLRWIALLWRLRRSARGTK
ncbi:MAG: glycosyltransferase family 2 protein [Planctomycetota bacterium]|jgi:glycosyltransferase involved in cell wall biosynthesis